MMVSCLVAGDLVRDIGVLDLDVDLVHPPPTFLLPDNFGVALDFDAGAFLRAEAAGVLPIVQTSRGDRGVEILSTGHHRIAISRCIV